MLMHTGRDTNAETQADQCGGKAKLYSYLSENKQKPTTFTSHSGFPHFFHPASAASVISGQNPPFDWLQSLRFGII